MLVARPCLGYSRRSQDQSRNAAGHRPEARAVPPLRTKASPVRRVSSWAMARIRATWRACSGVNGWCSNGPGGVGLWRVLAWWYRWFITHTPPSACVLYQQSSGVACPERLDGSMTQARWPARGAACLALWCRAIRPLGA